MNTLITQEQEKSLIQAATQIRENSYSPYSHFAVGAALLMQDGSMVLGTNVENLSYGLTICAERNAVASAVAQRKKGIVAVAVVTASKTPASPCGACRQVLAEFAPDVQLILANTSGNVVRTHLQAIFSSQFSKDQLESGASSK